MKKKNGRLSDRNVNLGHEEDVEALIVVRHTLVGPELSPILDDQGLQRYP